MSDELQAAAAPAESEAEQQAITGTPELAPGEAGENQGNNQSDKVEFTPEQQEVLDKAVNRQHKKFREAERAQLDTEALLATAQGRISEFEASQPAPVIPEARDRMDFDTDAEYNDHVTLRDGVIRADAEFRQQQGYIAQAQQVTANDRVIAEQTRQAENGQTLSDNATKLGIKIDDLVKASEVIGDYKLAPELVEELMTNEDGPVMMAHLAANPLELDALRSLPLGRAFNMLNSTVRQSAQTLKPKTSSTPPPPDVLSGNGVPEQGDPRIEGIQFE